jgi:hypothetical protein
VGRVSGVAWSSLRQAWIVLLATVIGGVLTAGGGVLVERLRWKRDERREFRQAGRLILAELNEVTQAIPSAARTHTAWPVDSKLPSSVWRGYRAVLAVHLGEEAWRWLESAYDSVDRLNRRVIELGPPSWITAPTSKGALIGLRKDFGGGQYVFGVEETFSLPTIDCEGNGPYSAFATVGRYTARRGNLSASEVTCGEEA